MSAIGVIELPRLTRVDERAAARTRHVANLDERCPTTALSAVLGTVAALRRRTASLLLGSTVLGAVGAPDVG